MVLLSYFESMLYFLMTPHLTFYEIFIQIFCSLKVVYLGFVNHCKVIWSKSADSWKSERSDSMHGTKTITSKRCGRSELHMLQKSWDSIYVNLQRKSYWTWSMMFIKEMDRFGMFSVCLMNNLLDLVVWWLGVFFLRR